MQRRYLLSWIVGIGVAMSSRAAFVQADIRSFHTSVVAPPRNPLQSSRTLKLQVSDIGIQRVTGDDLAAAGLQIEGVKHARLHIRLNGDELAAEIIDHDNDGAFDANDELRFFAPTAGDRWNRTTTYWLSQEDGNGLRMQTRTYETRDVQAIRATAMGFGEWRNNRVYESKLSGNDGDHWFAAKFDSQQTSLYTQIESMLPFAPGNLSITVRGASDKGSNTSLSLTDDSQNRDNANMQLATQTSESDWTFSFSLAAQANAQKQIIQINANEGARVDWFSWEAPVSLVFNGHGGTFRTADGLALYELSQVSDDSALYDVSDPTAPVVVQLSVGEAKSFVSHESGRYILSGQGSIFAPTAQPRRAVDLVSPMNVDVVYIAPFEFHNALQPLVALRQSQGLKVALVDSQAVFETWNFGQTSPNAIRDFLRYARSSWSAKPRAVVLVGDGSYDPRNYSGNQDASIIPPYLANIDDWVGEIACDACFAQLDGDDPLSDTTLDVMFGRLPVRNASDAQTVVSKIVDYESAASSGWRWRNAFVADNFQDENGVKDSAGNFAFLMDRAASYQPQTALTSKMYYDPFPPSAQKNSYRISDSSRARERTLNLFNEGATFIAYSGHGLHQQWASISKTKDDKTYLMNSSDIAAMTNRDRLPIVLEMACLTGAFQTPTQEGGTIDEQLLLAPNGGAVAVWASSGWGVLYIHDILLKGFFEKYWSSPGDTVRLGELTRAGYEEVQRNAGCCQNLARNYVLLGDPMMQVRKSLPTNRYFLSIVAR